MARDFNEIKARMVEKKQERVTAQAPAPQPSAPLAPKAEAPASVAKPEPKPAAPPAPTVTRPVQAVTPKVEEIKPPEPPAAPEPPKFSMPPDARIKVDYQAFYDRAYGTRSSSVNTTAKLFNIAPERLEELALIQGVDLDAIIEARKKGRTYDEIAKAGRERGVIGFMPVEEREAVFSKTLIDFEKAARGEAPELEGLKRAGADKGFGPAQALAGYVAAGTQVELPEVSKPGEHGYTVASLLVDAIRADKEASKIFDLYGRSLETGATQGYIRDRTEQLRKQAGIGPSDPESVQKVAALRKRAINEVIAYKTVGQWTPAVTLGDIEVTEGREAPSFLGAMKPNVEIVGFNNKRQAIFRQESPMGVAFRVVDVPQAATVGVLTGKGAAAGVQSGSNFLEYAMETTKDSAPYVRAPALAAGLAASIAFPDLTLFGGKAASLAKGAYQSARVKRVAPKVAELLSTIAEARKNKDYTKAIEAEIALRKYTPDIASAHDRYDAATAAKQQIIDPVTDTMNEDLASLIASRIPAVADEAASRSWLHPSVRKDVLSVKTPTKDIPFTAYDELYNTDRLLKRVGKAKADYLASVQGKTLADYATDYVRGAARSIVTNLADDVLEAAKITPQQIDEIADVVARSGPLTLRSMDDFKKAVRDALKADPTFSDEAYKPIRQALYRRIGQVERKVADLKKVQSVDELVAPDIALFDRAIKAIEQNNEARGAAAEMLRDEIAGQAKIRVVPSNLFADVAPKLPSGEPMTLSAGGLVALAQLRRVAPEIPLQEAYAATLANDKIFEQAAKRAGIDVMKFYEQKLAGFRRGDRDQFVNQLLAGRPGGAPPAPAAPAAPAAAPAPAAKPAFSVSAHGSTASKWRPSIPANMPRFDVESAADAKQILDDARRGRGGAGMMTATFSRADGTVGASVIALGDVRVLVDSPKEGDAWKVIVKVGQEQVELPATFPDERAAKFRGVERAGQMIDARVVRGEPAIKGVPASLLPDDIDQADIIPTEMDDLTVTDRPLDVEVLDLDVTEPRLPRPAPIQAPVEIEDPAELLVRLRTILPRIDELAGTDTGPTLLRSFQLNIGRWSEGRIGFDQLKEFVDRKSDELAALIRERGPARPAVGKFRIEDAAIDKAVEVKKAQKAIDAAERKIKILSGKRAEIDQKGAAAKTAAAKRKATAAIGKVDEELREATAARAAAQEAYGAAREQARLRLLKETQTRIIEKLAKKAGAKVPQPEPTAVARLSDEELSNAVKALEEGVPGPMLDDLRAEQARRAAKPTPVVVEEVVEAPVTAPTVEAPPAAAATAPAGLVSAQRTDFKSVDEFKQAVIDAGGAGFVTKQGSVYQQVGPLTQRFKTPHIEHDPKDVGLKKPSKRTIYLRAKLEGGGPDRLRETGVGVSNASTRWLIDDTTNRAYLVSRVKDGPIKEYRFDVLRKDADGKTIPFVEFDTQPFMGAVVLELFDDAAPVPTMVGKDKVADLPGHKSFHPGNQITEMFGSEAAVPPTPAPIAAAVEAQPEAAKIVEAPVKRKRATRVKAEAVAPEAAPAPAVEVAPPSKAPSMAAVEVPTPAQFKAEDARRVQEAAARTEAVLSKRPDLAAEVEQVIRAPEWKEVDKRLVAESGRFTLTLTSFKSRSKKNPVYYNFDVTVQTEVGPRRAFLGTFKSLDEAKSAVSAARLGVADAALEAEAVVASRKALAETDAARRADEAARRTEAQEVPTEAAPPAPRIDEAQQAALQTLRDLGVDRLSPEEAIPEEFLSTNDFGEWVDPRLTNVRFAGLGLIGRPRKGRSADEMLDLLTRANGDLAAAVREVASTTTVPEFRVVAERILALEDEMRETPLVLVRPGSAEAATGMQIGAAGWYDPSANTVNIFGPEYTSVGLSEETLLHEVLHSLTHKRLHADNIWEMGRLRLTKASEESLRQGRRAIYSVFEDLKKHVERAISDGTATPFERSPAMKDYLLDQSPDELISWALTDAGFQDYLKSVKLPKSAATMWQRFVRSLGVLLGFDLEATNALARVVEASDQLLGAKYEPLPPAATLAYGAVKDAASQVQGVVFALGWEIGRLSRSIGETAAVKQATAFREAESLVRGTPGVMVLQFSDHAPFNQAVLRGDYEEAQRMLDGIRADQDLRFKAAVAAVDDLPIPALRNRPATSLRAHLKEKYDRDVKAAFDTAQKALNEAERVSKLPEAAPAVKPPDVFPSIEAEAPMPSGIPSARAVQTETPEFKRWFGDSKVVDTEGKPLVVYHSGLFDVAEDPVPRVGREGFHFGTLKAAEERDAGKRVDDFVRSIKVDEAENEFGEPAWFWQADGVDSYDMDPEGFPSAESAKRAAERFAQEQEFVDVEPMPMTPAFLSIKNPKRVLDQKDNWEPAIRQAKAEGYDGIVYRNEFEDKGSDSYIVFEPTQIKSATGNVGTFSQTDPSILKQVSPTGEVKGATEWLKDGRALITLFEGADASTVLHEVAHVVRRNVLNADDMEAITTWIKSRGVKVGHEFGEFTGDADEVEKAEELFAKAFEQYVAEGAVPTPALTTIFDILKNAVGAVYRGVSDPVIGTRLQPQVRALFDGLLTTTTEQAAPTLKQVIRREILGGAEDEEDFFDILAREAQRKGIGRATYDDLMKRFDEAEASAKAQNRNLRDTDVIFEFPAPVFGKRDWTFKDLVQEQAKRETASKLKAARRAGIRMDLAATGRGTAALVREETPVESLRAAVAARDTDTPMTANVRSAFRTVVGAFFGGDVVLEQSGDARNLLRQAPPEFRKAVNTAVRVVEQSIGDTVGLLNDAVDLNDSSRLLDYLSGSTKVRRANGRPVLSSGHDYMGSVLQMWSRRFAQLPAEERVAMEYLADAVNAPDASTRLARLGFNMDGTTFNVADAAAEKIREGVVRAAGKMLYSSKSGKDVDFGEALSQALRNAVEAPDNMRPSHEMRLLETITYVSGSTARNGALFKGDSRKAAELLIFGEPGKKNGIRNIYDDESARRATVLVGGFGASSLAKDVMLNIDLGVDAATQRGFANWLAGEQPGWENVQKIQDMIDRYGFNPEFVRDPILDMDFYIPRMARERIAQALSRSTFRPQEALTGGDLLRTGFTYWKLRVTRGNLFIRQRYFMMNTVDNFNAVGITAGFGVAAANSARVVAQDLMVLPLWQQLVLAARNLPGGQRIPADILERARVGLQKLGDRGAQRIASMMGVSKYRIEVNPVLEGLDGGFRAGGKVYSYREIRRIAVEEGVFASFETRELQNAILREGELVIRQTTQGPTLASGTNKGRAASILSDWQNSVKDVADAWSERERLGTMITLMEAGHDPRTAARVTIDALYDYSQTMTKGDRAMLVSILFPFWAFQKNANAQIFNMLFSPSGAYRMMAIKRARERSADLMTAILYDDVTDEYGVDVESMPPELQDSYYAVITSFEESFGPDGPPPEAKQAMRLLLAGRAMDIVGGKLVTTSPTIMRLQESGALAEIEKFQAFAVAEPSKAGRASFMRDRAGVAVSTPRTEAVRTAMALLGDDHAYMEMFWPDSVIEAGMKYHTQVAASMLLMGAYGADFMGLADLKEAGLEGVSPLRVLEPVADPTRSPVVAAIASGEILGSAPPKRLAPLLTPEGMVKIHPYIGKMMDDYYGAAFLRVPKEIDPFIVNEQGQLTELPPDMQKRIRALQQEYPDIGVIKDQRYYVFGGKWAVAFDASPLGELNSLLLQWEEEPLQRADIRGEILRWARGAAGVDVSLTAPSRTVKYEEPTKPSETRKF